MIRARTTIRISVAVAAIALGLAAGASAASAARYTSEIVERYPRPAGTRCVDPLPNYTAAIAQGQTVCVDLDAADLYEQEVKTFRVDAGTGTSATWQPATDGVWVVQPLNVCTWMYPSYDTWVSMGSSRASNVCVRVDYELVEHRFRTWLLAGLPVELRAQFEPRTLVTWEWRVRGKLSQTSKATGQYIAPYGATAASICQSFQADGERGFARPDTPQFILDACGFSGIATSSTGGGSTTTTIAAPVGATGFRIPARSARCGRLRDATRGRVVVRSVRVRCRVSRTIIARYARTLRSPRRWSCIAVVRDSGMRVRCQRKVRRSGSARARIRASVYGAWVGVRR